MTVNNPPSYLQGDGPNAEQHRSHMTAAFGERPGVLASDALVVTERTGTANMSVDVSDGHVLIEGTEGTYQGLYLCHNRGVQNVAINTSDPANARYDLIVARAQDADYSGATNAWSLEAVQGAAAATPLFPAVPDNCFVLATVLVGASVSSITNSDITDIRASSDTDGTSTLTNTGFASTRNGVIVCDSSARPPGALGRVIFEADTGILKTWNGTLWVPIQSSTFNTAGSLNSATTTTAVTDLTLSHDLVAGESYRIHWDGFYYGDTLSDNVRFRIVGPGASPVYKQWDYDILKTGTAVGASGSAWFTAVTTGATTFSLQHFRSFGTGTVYCYADVSTQRYCQLAIEKVS